MSAAFELKIAVHVRRFIDALVADGYGEAELLESIVGGLLIVCARNQGRSCRETTERLAALWEILPEERSLWAETLLQAELAKNPVVAGFGPTRDPEPA